MKKLDLVIAFKDYYMPIESEEFTFKNIDEFTSKYKDFRGVANKLGELIGCTIEYRSVKGVFIKYTDDERNAKLDIICKSYDPEPIRWEREKLLGPDYEKTDIPYRTINDILSEEKKLKSRW